MTVNIKKRIYSNHKDRYYCIIASMVMLMVPNDHAVFIVTTVVMAIWNNPGKIVAIKAKRQRWW